MATISGRVVFDVNRTATIDGSDTGIGNVPVVLQDVNTQRLLTVLTDANGNYSFLNVPNGNYIIVEAYGHSGGVATPGDFNTAVVGPVPTGEDPPISFTTNPPAGVNNLDSLTPNTLLVTVAGADLTNENFLDGPVIDTPIGSLVDSCATIIPGNLITAADNGTFGVFPAGTAVETGAPVVPYPGVTTGFVYTLPSPPAVRPFDGSYTVQNIMTNMSINASNTWWRISDHTVGDETGRFMAIGGSNPGSPFFEQTVSVTPNTNYLFSSWILNLIRNPALAQPALGVEILDQNGAVLYAQTLGSAIPTNTIAPEWKEIGTAFNSGSNSQVTVKFLSEGPAAAGNDFAIDDVKLQQITIPQFVPVKSVSPSFADVGSTVTYTVTLANPCSYNLTNLSFNDTVPNGLSFVSGSVTINGASAGAADPQAGFSIPNIAAGSTATVTFKATVNSLPIPNPANNVATMKYSYSPISGGIPTAYTNNSNVAPLQVNNANLAINKSADKQTAIVGETITYTITVTNSGNVNANPALVTDILPSGTTYVSGSLTVDGVPNASNPSTGVNVGPVAPGQTKTIKFNATVNANATLPIQNTAKVNYQYTVDPANPPVSVTKSSNTVTVSVATIQIVKAVDKQYLTLGDTLTYTNTITNTGNAPIENVVFTDTPPAGTNYVNPSVRINGVLYPGLNPNVAIDLKAVVPALFPLQSGQFITVSYSVTVDVLPANPIIPNTSSATFAYTDGVQTKTSTANSNTVQSEVRLGKLEITKITDKQIAQIGTPITYTLLVKNTGNVDVNNSIITDPIPAGALFVSGSVLVDGISNPTGNPATGINIGTVSPNQTKTIVFKVTTNSPVTINNTASGTYSFIVTPGANPVNASATSNNVTTIATTSFTCDSFGYNVYLPSGSTNSTLSRINLVTGNTTTVNSNIGLNLNAIGYNVSDNFIYGIKYGTNELVAMDANGVTYNLGAVPNLPVANYDVGAIDKNGYLYIRNSTTNTYYVINTNQSSPTFGQLVDPTAGFVLDTAPYGTTLSQNLPFNDWTFGIDGNLYGVEGNGTVVRVNPLTGTVTALATTGVPGGALYESAYSMSDGYIYATNNVTGGIYRIAISGNSAVGLPFSTQTPVTQSDGTSCLNATISIDFGDAPTSYKTLLSANGPRHAIVNALTLGNTITSEGDAYASANALGDDQTKGIQDDGTSIPLTNMALNATTYTITETVLNNTGSSANIYAWVDFNKDGIFQTNEGTTAIVPSSPSPQNISLTFTVPASTTLTPGNTFVRVRTTTDTLINTGTATTEDTRSFGPASDGEVEDYQLTIEDTKINSNKSVNPVYVDLGGTITYSVTLTNPGTIPVNNVLFTDPLPSGVTYANNLLVSVPYTGTDPMTGLTITSINPGQTVTISWDVKVGNTVPTPNPISNTGTVTIPGLPPTTTNVVTTQVNNAKLAFVKSVDKQTATFGDTLTYTIQVTNSGNVNANPALVTDLLPPGTTYIPGSLTVDGVANPSNITTGVDVGPVAPGQTKTILFSVTINPNATLPIENTANVDYKYIVDPTKPPVSVTTPSNKVDVNVADIEIVKSVDKQYIQVGDTLTYTNIITSTGNAPIENVVFTDTPPVGTTYVNPSVKINGVLYPALTPNGAIDLKSVVPALFPLQPGEFITVSYSVTVDTLPANPVIPNTSSATFEYKDGNQTKTSTTNSNEVNSTVRNGDIQITKSANKTIVEVGDTLTYTINVLNTGNIDIQNVIITDPVPTGTTFVNGSVKVNGSTRPSDSPITGINLGTIVPGQIVVITFDVLVNQMPSSGQLENTANGSYQFIVDPTKPPVTENKNSNTVITQVENVEIKIIKNCTPSGVSIGDEINYSFTIINTGSVDVTNIKFFDVLPNEVTFIDNSFVGSTQPSVNASDLVSGVSIGNLASGAQKNIYFKVVLTKTTCPPTVCNKSSITADYQLVQGQTLTKTFESNECCIDIKSNTFKQTYIDGNLTIPSAKPDIESILSLDVTTQVMYTDEVISPVGSSQEGQTLTGKKMLICTKFYIKVVYVSATEEQSAHSAQYELSKCDYIVVSDTDNTCCNYASNIIIEDIYYDIIDNRHVFYNITYLIENCS